MGLAASLSRPLLCLFDRNFDLGSALQHVWTYKPLVRVCLCACARARVCVCVCAFVCVCCCVCAGACMYVSLPCWITLGNGLSVSSALQHARHAQGQGMLKGQGTPKALASS